ncbi:MAG: hypothetical protein FGM42_01800 [Ilumatobacteraceae bacterium]|nr:hypothetical protein [Ilumatobacteraceae bacterium]
MFNLSGGEIVVLLLLGLVVLGPEKLPDAMRKFGRVYNEVKRVAGGIQRDVSAGFSDPVNELKKTANEARRMFSGDEPLPPEKTRGAEPEPIFVPYEPAPERPDAADEETPPRLRTDKVEDDDDGAQN